MTLAGLGMRDKWWKSVGGTGMRNRNPGLSGEHGNLSPANPGGGCEVVATQKLVSVLHAAATHAGAIAMRMQWGCGARVCVSLLHAIASHA